MKFTQDTDMEKHVYRQLFHTISYHSKSLCVHKIMLTGLSGNIQLQLTQTHL